MTFSVEGQWEQDWFAHIAEQENKTGVPTSMWRTAGRATKAKPNGEDLDFWRYEGLSASLEYAKWMEARLADGWRIASFAGQPMVEFAVSGVFGGIEVKGYVDLVMEPAAEDLLVIDAKTGSRHPASVHQLALYAQMIADLGLPRPKLGAFYMTRQHSLGPIEMLDMWDRSYWEKQFSKLAEAKEHGIFLPNVSDHCRGCGVNRFCYAYGGVEAHLYDPDHPDYAGAKAEV